MAKHCSPDSHSLVVCLQIHLDWRSGLRQRHRVHRVGVGQVEESEAAVVVAGPLAVPMFRLNRTRQFNALMLI